MRNARSVAWFSTAGFHQRSKWMTCEAAVRFRPVPPAFSESTKKGGPVVALEFVDQLLPPLHGRPAVQDEAAAAEDPTTGSPTAARSFRGTA